MENKHNFLNTSYQSSPFNPPFLLGALVTSWTVKFRLEWRLLCLPNWDFQVPKSPNNNGKMQVNCFELQEQYAAHC